MITVVTYISLADGITREELLDKYRKTAPAWSKNEDLIQKYYFFDPLKNRGGGVYVWKSMEAAKRWHGDEYKKRIKSLYGSEAEIHYYDTLLIVDNANKTMSEPNTA
jgi:hypothetical protein